MIDIELRPGAVADAEVFAGHRRDEAAARSANVWRPPHDWFLDHWSRRVLAEPTNLVRTVLVDGATAGYVMCWSDEDDRMIDFWLGREYWGRGIGTEAVRSFLAVEPGRPLHAETPVRNVAAIRVLTKCGFIRVRTDGGIANYYGGTSIDHAVLRLN